MGITRGTFEIFGFPSLIEAFEGALLSFFSPQQQKCKTFHSCCTIHKEFPYNISFGTEKKPAKYDYHHCTVVRTKT